MGNNNVPAKGRLSLSDSYDGETFYQELINTDYWDDEGYRLTNEKVVYQNGDHDFGATASNGQDPVDRYHAQFSALRDDAESHWIHVDVPGSTADKVGYLVTMGPPHAVVNDLTDALKEVESKLSP